MSTRPHLHLKSVTTTPDRPHAAPQPVGIAAVGEPTGAARQGVRTSPDPHTDTSDNPTPDRPGIRIFAPPVYRHPNDGGRWSKRYGSTPNAAYACPCGQTGPLPERSQWPRWPPTTTPTAPSAPEHPPRSPKGGRPHDEPPRHRD